MRVNILYFAWIRERTGVDSEPFEIEGPLPLSALVDRLAAQSPGHASAFADRARVRAAINQDFAGWDAEVRDGDEVALFPPVTGG